MGMIGLGVAGDKGWGGAEAERLLEGFPEGGLRCQEERRMTRKELRDRERQGLGRWRRHPKIKNHGRRSENHRRRRGGEKPNPRLEGEVDGDAAHGRS